MISDLSMKRFFGMDHLITKFVSSKKSSFGSFHPLSTHFSFFSKPYSLETSIITTFILQKGLREDRSYYYSDSAPTKGTNPLHLGENATTMGILVKAVPSVSIRDGEIFQRRRNRKRDVKDPLHLDTSEIDLLIGEFLNPNCDGSGLAQNRGRSTKRGKQKKKRSKKLQRSQYSRLLSPSPKAAQEMVQEKCPSSDTDSQSTIPLSENSDNENDTAFSGVSKLSQASRNSSSRLSMFSRASVVSKSTQASSSSRLSRIIGKFGKSWHSSSKSRRKRSNESNRQLLSIVTSASSIFDFGDDDDEYIQAKPQDDDNHADGSSNLSGVSKHSDAIFQATSNGELDPVFVSGLGEASFDDEAVQPELRINLTDAISALVDDDEEGIGYSTGKAIPGVPKEEEPKKTEPVEYSDNPDQLGKKHQKRHYVMPDEYSPRKPTPIRVTTCDNPDDQIGMHRGRNRKSPKPKHDEDSLIELIEDICNPFGIISCGELWAMF